jgi:hypothetical protein
VPDDQNPRSWGPSALAGWGLLFLAAAVANGGGYRYGASDQAFYIPAVLHHLDPGLFPRDWALLASQDRFSIFPAAAAWLSRATGLSLPALFFALYLAGLGALLATAVGLGRRLFRSRWTLVSLAFALTLRHAVALGAVNTLESYMHPRMLAFGLGGMAVAASLASRPVVALLLVGVAAVCHPTTAVWFVVWIGAATAVANRTLRVPLLVAGALGIAVAAWLVFAGPLAGRLTAMDPEWLAALGQKRYLFPSRWPVTGWLPAILTPALAAGLFRLRQRRGLVTPPETGVAAGAAILFAAFLASVPLTAAHLVLAVQLQIPRTLWLIDLLAVTYVAWYAGEGGRAASATSTARRARAAALVFLALSLGRGAYVMLVEHPERGPVQVDVVADDWSDAMRWIAANTDKGAWLLAPPGHAWQYGTSARITSRRDVYLEEAKDSAIAMYSRAGALAVVERAGLLQGFEEMTEARARALAARGPNLLVIERDLALPLLYRNARFRVYGLK